MKEYVNRRRKRWDSTASFCPRVRQCWRSPFLIHALECSSILYLRLVATDCEAHSSQNEPISKVIRSTTAVQDRNRRRDERSCALLFNSQLPTISFPISIKFFLIWFSCYSPTLTLQKEQHLELTRSWFTSVTLCRWFGWIRQQCSFSSPLQKMQSNFRDLLSFEK